MFNAQPQAPAPIQSDAREEPAPAATERAERTRPARDSIDPVAAAEAEITSENAAQVAADLEAKIAAELEAEDLPAEPE